MANYIIGTIKKIFETKKISDKFQKRDFVLTTKEQYPQNILIQFTQDRCSVLDGYMEGQEVSAHINIKGKEFTDQQGKISFFNSIECWKLEEPQYSYEGETSVADIPSSAASVNTNENLSDDGLPF